MRITKEEALKRQQSNERGRKKLPEILRFLSTVEYIDDEALAYCPNEYPFTLDEFHDVYYYLKTFNNAYKNLNEKLFVDYIAPFKAGSMRFFWRHLSGQGDALQLIRYIEGDAWCGRFYYDKNKEIVLDV